ncbi:Eco29kI family restriction endonuclease [Stenotrophomonas maltophilia]|uniref:Eco29kI family restriction endonuclease n=1 Tax=Stenotrophomonas maltophilia TaxID=40324 RepID=UPI003317C505
MTAKVIPFNPLDKKNLGASVAEALLTKEVHPLNELPAFDGAGIYAIYYTGGFEAYGQIARLNNGGKFMLPIYVGKAVPAGARVGAGNDVPAGRVLFKRLKEHADSIQSATNLAIEDFFCRFLVVDDIWIPLGESLIISRFTPLWNSLIDGFGNHNPGKGRYAGMRPRWDVLHPGRRWAEQLAGRPESPQRVAEDAATYLRTLPACLSDRFVGE